MSTRSEGEGWHNSEWHVQVILDFEQAVGQRINIPVRRVDHELLGVGIGCSVRATGDRKEARKCQLRNSKSSKEGGRTICVHRVGLHRSR